MSTGQQGGNRSKFVEFISPIGRLVYCYLDQAQPETGENGQPKLDKDGVAIAHFKCTMIWPKEEYNTTLIDMRTKAAQARDLHWPPGSYDPSWFRLEPFLRDGDDPSHNTKGKQELRGHYYMTFKCKGKPSRDAQGRIVYSGAPGLIGPYNEDLLPSDVYSGCFARVSGIMFGSEYSGKKFVSVRLNNVQKARDGERIGGGRPDARSQFDPLATGPAPQAQNPAPQGFGQPAGGFAPQGGGFAPQGGFPAPQQPGFGQPHQPQQGFAQQPGFGAPPSIL